MASTYSSLLRLELIGTGDQSGTWGTTTNTNIGTLLEKSIAGTATIDVTSGNVTLSTDDGADDEARCMILKVTGTPGTTRNIVAPSSSKMYVVLNGSDGSVVVKGSATTGVTVTSGTYAIVAWTGSDFETVAKAPPAGDIVTTDATQTLTNKTLTSPKLGTALADLNGNALLKPSATGGSPVNEFTIANAVTGDSPLFAASGSDTNIDITLVPKGTGIAKSSTTFSDASGALRAVPAVGEKTSSYNLAVGDVGKFVSVGSGGSITIPNAVFSAGDVVSIFNNTTGDVTITCSITVAYIAGTNTDVSSVTLATRGVATVLFISGTTAVIAGNVS